jgi:hypothetical protein
MGPRLRFVFRHFPLTQVHPHALHAAAAAEAAADQGKFWEMHDTLYEHQEALADAERSARGSGVPSSKVVRHSLPFGKGGDSPKV